MMYHVKKMLYDYTVCGWIIIIIVGCCCEVNMKKEWGIINLSTPRHVKKTDSRLREGNEEKK